MTFNDYQKYAAKTIQSYDSKDKETYILGYLGLAGEAGSVLTLLKKRMRDGEGFGVFNTKLKEELGDVLWYVAAIASYNKIDLEDIAVHNLGKTNDRFNEADLLKLPRYDSKYPERFPDEFTVRFTEELGENNLLQVKMFWEKEPGTPVELGDPLTDNSKAPNNYRFHDVFHLGHVAFLGWSPVMRQLMRLKRKSDPTTLETEDRGRPQVAEEAVTLIVYNYAKGNRMLKSSDRIDTGLLNTIKQLVVDLEVADVTAYQWEKTIIESYKVYHKLLENQGGRVRVSPAERKLTYLDE
jgi:NTP pyrophosphatase (non-canonical NTP hydrolase)